MDQKTEIRSYIKCRIRLNIDSKQISNELSGIYGPQTISMRTVFRWIKAFKAGKFSIEDDTRPGRPKTSVTKANIYRHSGSVVERPLCDREVAGSIPGRVIPKTLKMVLAWRSALRK